MGTKAENNKESQNYVELTENQIFEKIKKDLSPIQENLAEKKITINEARSELKKINEWIQGTKLESKDKKEIGKAFEKLIKLEKSIDENALKNEVDEIVKLVENLTKEDLANLRGDIKKNRKKDQQRRNPPRLPEVQEGIDEASNNLKNLSEQEDINPVADWARKKIREFGGFFS